MINLDVTFKRSQCLIVNNDSELIFEASRDRNIYTIELNDLSSQIIEC